jgi:DNA-directed RNA polymerase alpha subunit
MEKILISCKESRIENNRSFYGCFYLGPFEAGQSLTIANALRRTLLSEGVGLGITSVMIENVHHEYSTLPNVRDSVLDILLNLKEIVLKKVSNPWQIYEKTGLNSVYDEVGSSYFKPVVGYLKVKGQGVIRAKDLRLPPFIQCVDPNQYIATLTDDGLLNMKFIIMEGKNYFIQKSNSLMDSSLIKKRENLLNDLKDLLTSNKTSHKLKLKSKNDLETRPLKNSFRNSSFLNIDAIFNPVTKVNYIIEVSENQLVKNALDKSAFVDDLTSLLNSSVLLKKNLPFLKTLFSNLKAYNNEVFSAEGLATLGAGGGTESVDSFMKHFLDYVDNLSTTEFSQISTSLNPLKKGGIKHNIILEIWTNGSQHPRDALSNAFYNLSFLFLNFQKTKILNPIYNNSLTYKETFNLLNETTHQTGVDKTSIEDKTLRNESQIRFSSAEDVEGDNSSDLLLGEAQQQTNRLQTEKRRKMEMDIGSLNLSLRSYIKLKRANVNTINDLSEISEAKLAQILDKKSLFEVKKAVFSTTLLNDIK